MTTPQLTPSPWLSAEMARALAAICPPLKSEDIVRAADKLTAGENNSDVLRQLFQRDTELMQVRRVIEALRALRDHDAEP